MPSCTAEWHAPECPLSELSGELDDSEVDDVLLEEWDELTRRERAIESCMASIRNVIYQKYPDLEMAVVVLKDIRAINGRTPLQRRACLLRMKDRALNLMKLGEIKNRVVVIEELSKYQMIWSYNGERRKIYIEDGMK
ncbi:hypothetical protein PRIPAC_96157 [Pristionchus pacificus]|uniref:Uncharacterized protein n=1 Tax=Pristionchus pacificus TaxID=54126 RepID=A0A2A6D1F8_PRIPA|nr:hypothetical protein PRIPAC_96157 [Pristionchus pacificus]|eukprot:PDM84208.1 hypothetical protein PRIPAC_33231 [Pristionchus pacificus]